jgi:hypothetical protein
MIGNKDIRLIWIETLAASYVHFASAQAQPFARAKERPGVNHISVSRQPRGHDNRRTED